MSDLPSPHERAHHGPDEKLQTTGSSTAGRLDQARAGRGRDAGPPRAGAPEVGTLSASLARRIGAEQFDAYFKDQTRLSLEGSGVVVTVPAGFVAEAISRRFIDEIRRAAQDMGRADANARVDFRVDPDAFARAAAPAVDRSRPRPAPPAPRSGLQGLAIRHRLDDFIVGEANRAAHTAAMAMVLREAHAPRLMFLHGASGMGKTHLAQGLARAYADRHPGAVVHATNGEVFTDECIGAMRGLKGATMEALHERYRRVDLLFIDDVHYVSSKQKTQSELLHTIDQLDLSGARLVFVSDDHPRHVRDLSRALVSRFMSGLVVRVDAPDVDLLERIALRKAADRALPLDRAAARFLAEHCPSLAPGTPPSVRDLEGALTRVANHTRVRPDLLAAGGAIGINLVRAALAGDAGESPRVGMVRRPVRGEEIVAGVCSFFRVELDELKGRGRHPRVVLARSAAAWLARSMTTMSFPEIARVLGRPNHSTVVTACQRIGKSIEGDEAMDLGRDRAIPELAGLSVRDAVERLRQEILRSAGA